MCLSFSSWISGKSTDTNVMGNSKKHSANGPDFIIIGAMKCATSALHDQLVLQPYFFMSTPKEPNYFSDDEVYAKGEEWYTNLFVKSKSGLIRGESSTHYTKQPTYPKTVERMLKYAPEVKFIYVMRHPVERLISHYIHEWSQGVIGCDINKAIKSFPELLDYGCYDMQLDPYLKQFGSLQVLPLFAERLRSTPLRELETIFEFLNIDAIPVWHSNTLSNVSAERMKHCKWRDAIVDNSVLQVLRRTFVPKKMRTKIRNLWTIKKRPTLSSESLNYVEKIFNRDLEKLSSKLGIELNCGNFKETVVLPKRIKWSGGDGA